MQEVLLALTVAGLVTVALVVGGAFALRWQLRRANRVHPKVTTAAPTTWLVAPTAPARLHRRLRTTVRVTAIGPGPAPEAVVEHAADLDRHLVLAARLPLAQRVPELRRLSAQVDELDRLARTATRALAAPVGDDPLERLRLLAEARDEVEAIDARHQLPA